MSPCMRSRTWFASHPIARMSPERYSASASSAESRSCAITLSWMGFSRESSVWKGWIFLGLVVCEAVDIPFIIAHRIRSKPRMSTHWYGSYLSNSGSVLIRENPWLLWFSPRQQHVSGNEEEERHRDQAVHGEKCCVYATEVVVLHQRVLVDQQHCDKGHAGDGNLAERERNHHPRQQSHGDDVKQAGDSQRLANAKCLRYRVDAGGAVEFIILAAIQDVESGAPEDHGRSQY